MRTDPLPAVLLELVVGHFVEPAVQAIAGLTRGELAKGDAQPGALHAGFGRRANRDGAAARVEVRNDLADLLLDRGALRLGPGAAVAADGVARSRSLSIAHVEPT